MSLVEDLRADMPRLGGVKLWRLLNDNGVRIGRDDLYDMLRRHGLLVRRKRRRAVTTDSRCWHRQHPNLVKGLLVDRPNQVWVSDITYVPTSSGFVYLSLVTDAYSRRIMGWHVHAGLDTGGPLRALYLALWQVDDGELAGLIHHSDRGCQYCSAQYVDTLAERRMLVSVTQDGSPYDNAVAESFFATLKNEMYSLRSWAARAEARHACVEFIEGYYNRQRPHSTIGYQIPAERMGAFMERMETAFAGDGGKVPLAA